MQTSCRRIPSWLRSRRARRAASQQGRLTTPAPPTGSLRCSWPWPSRSHSASSRSVAECAPGRWSRRHDVARAGREERQGTPGDRDLAKPAPGLHARAGRSRVRLAGRDEFQVWSGSSRCRRAGSKRGRGLVVVPPASRSGIHGGVRGVVDRGTHSIAWLPTGHRGGAGSAIRNRTFAGRRRLESAPAGGDAQGAGGARHWRAGGRRAGCGFQRSSHPPCRDSPVVSERVRRLRRVRSTSASVSRRPPIRAGAQNRSRTHR